MERLVLPTRDLMVKERLRELDAPIGLFGEDARDRRDRLRKLLVSQGLFDGVPRADTLGWAAGGRDGSSRSSSGGGGERSGDGGGGSDDVEVSEQAGEFFSPCPLPGLRETRRALAEYSLGRARERLRRMRERDQAVTSEVAAVQSAIRDLSLADDPSSEETQAIFNRHIASIDGPLSSRKRALGCTQGLALALSHTGDGRPLGCCAAAPDGRSLAVGSWSGNCLIYPLRREQVGDLTEKDGDEKAVQTLVGHTGRLVDLAWRESTLLSCDVGGDILLWSQGADAAMPTSGPTRLQQRHASRVNRLAVHPWGRHFGSTSHDLTWRLWDFEAQREVCQQEGHAKAPFAMAFHPDGSLAATGGEDAAVRLWDLRSGKSVAHFQEHSQAVYAASFHPDGLLLATAGADNQIRVRDLRRNACRHIVPAHNSSITRLAYEPSGDCLVSAGYDQKVRFWSTNDYSQVTSLSGHTGLIMGLSVTSSTRTDQPSSIFTCSYDKTWKRWA